MFRIGQLLRTTRCAPIFFENGQQEWVEMNEVALVNHIGANNAHFGVVFLRAGERAMGFDLDGTLFEPVPEVPLDIS